VSVARCGLHLPNESASHWPAVVNRRAAARLLTFVAAAFLSCGVSSAVDITVTGSVAGTTPEIVGYNSGHFMPGSNTADWWRYSGVNGARVWPTPSVVETGDDRAPWGDGVESEASFMTRRSMLRSDPASRQYIFWPEFEGNYANNPTTGANIINLKHAFTELRALDIDPLVEIHRSNNGSYAFDPIDTADGWADRWEYWQHFYAQAFYLAKNFDVHRFQMYNEPNLDEDLPVSEYVERLKFASDAVQSAVADVNSIYGKSLVAEVNAPVTAGAASQYAEWGAPVMQNMHNTIDPAFRLIHTYSYQQYNATGETFASQLGSVKASVNADANGEPMRFAITEFNVHTASTFDGLSETLDTPSKSSRLGSILANLANARADELYVFKFSQGPGDGESGVKKNGTHFVDNNSAPYDIGGVTKGGEVVRLFAKSFAGSNTLFSIPPATGSGAGDLRLAASQNTESDSYYLFSANEATANRPLAVNLSAWGIEPGTRIVVEEVSGQRHGEVSQLFTVPQNQVISLTQAPQSVLLFSIPKTKSANYITLDATDDAMVKSGFNAGANFGDSVNLYAKNDAADPAARNVSFIKFDTGKIKTSEIEQAVFQVWGANVGTATEVIAHVYALTNDAWDEETITWDNAPNLKDSLGTSVDDISENFLEGVGTSAHIVGQFSGVASGRTTGIDVTDFLRDHPDQQITFLIARKVRFDGENVDDLYSALQLASKERGTNPGPQLLLSLSGRALAGDFDGNGVVDMADYDVWRRDFGQTDDLLSDANQNGAVDAADYLIWRKNLGASLPGLNGTGGAVPEPVAAALVGLGLLQFALLQRERR